MSQPSLDRDLSIDTAFEASESLCYEKNDAAFIEKIPNGLYVGRAIHIVGRISDSPSRFSVDLLTKESNGDILFHFNPRFDRRIVVRNHFERKSWGQEEIAAGRQFPFQPGRRTHITIFVGDEKFLVSVNLKHWCGFPMRIPLEKARFLEIMGSISLESVTYSNSIAYPPLLPARLPRIIIPPTRLGSSLKRKKCKTIEPGTKVLIKGRIKLLPRNFYINLQVGSTVIPHPVIPLHINMRLCQAGLQEQQMILNSWANGSWGQELKPSECPFFPGLNFTIIIIYMEEGFHIKVNDESIYTFPMRLPYVPVIDTLLVEGDVFIHDVVIRQTNCKSVAQ